MLQKTILLTGGAGYIGSHVAYLAQQEGYRVVVLDSFAHQQRFDLPGVICVRGDIVDRHLVEQLCAAYQFDAVCHFAALIEVGQSVVDPALFYHHNVTYTLQLLEVMRTYGITRFVFSSSCAVYGVPRYLPLDEAHPCAPANPYGKTKLAIEFALQDYANAYKLQTVSLRYFNAAGALPELGLGEQHKPESHVLPRLIDAAVAGRVFKVYGDNYPTPDGTCVRDYVHVLDIAQAHVQALQYLEQGGPADAFNLGSEYGYSVKQLIDTTQEVLGMPVNTVVVEPRAGDVPVLVAQAQKARRILGWQPAHSTLDAIIDSAYRWHQQQSLQPLGVQPCCVSAL